MPVLTIESGMRAETALAEREIWLQSSDLALEYALLRDEEDWPEHRTAADRLLGFATIVLVSAGGWMMIVAVGWALW